MLAYIRRNWWILLLPAAMLGLNYWAWRHSLVPLPPLCVPHSTEPPGASLVEVAKAFADITKPIVDISTILALSVGGIWTYFLFVRKRANYPQANVSLKVSHVRLTDHMRLLRVGVQLENKGNVTLAPSRMLVWVQQVLPWPAAELGQAPNADLVADQESEIDWPLLYEKELAAPGLRYMRLEPNESDDRQFDVLLADNVDTVLIYTHVKAGRRSLFGKSEGEANEVGWTASRLHRLVDRLERSTNATQP